MPCGRRQPSIGRAARSASTAWRSNASSPACRTMICGRSSVRPADMWKRPSSGSGSARVTGRLGSRCSGHLREIAERPGQRNARSTVLIVEDISVWTPDARLRTGNSASPELWRDGDDGTYASGAKLRTLLHGGLQRKCRRGRESDRGSKEQSAHEIFL